MKTIALVDDKDYGLTQVKNAIPDDVEVDLQYFDSYEKALNQHFDIIVLDYYLDKDGVRSQDIINELDADIIISFSSVDSANQTMLNHGADFAAVKVRSSTNKELTEIFEFLLKQD